MEKRCDKCEKVKSVGDFYKQRSNKDGLRHDCKICVLKTQKQYFQTEKGRQNRKRYRQSEKGKQSHDRYNQSRKGRHTNGRYIKSEKGKQVSKRSRATRRTNKTQAGGSYTLTEWYNLCQFYDFHCLKCDKKLPFEKLSIDHVKLVSKGGSSYIWNTQPLCHSCNSSKGDKEIEYRQTLPNWIKRDGPTWVQPSLF